LDQNQKTKWENFYGGSQKDHFGDILLADDDGYLIAGSARSNDGDVSGNHGDVDIVVMAFTLPDQ
jgi:hypothetical protein